MCDVAITLLKGVAKARACRVQIDERAGMGVDGRWRGAPSALGDDVDPLAGASDIEGSPVM